MYRIFTIFYPYFLRKQIKNLLNYAAIKTEVQDFIGFTFFFGLLTALALSAIIYFFTEVRTVTTIIIFIATLIISQFFVYFTIVFKADKRASFVELVLPDALQLTSSNLRAGFTTERAFLLSARPEFGFFSEELTLLGKRIAGGKSIESSMVELTKKVKSEKLEKTVELIISGIKSGGELAMLLSQTAQNLRNEEIVEAKIRAGVFMYFIFILVAAGFASPILFALSSFLAETITTQVSLISIPEGVATPITITESPIPLNFIINFIIIVLVTLNVFGSLTLGAIKKGEIKEGVKYMPILLLVSLGLFFLVRIIIKNVFGFFI